MIRGPEFIVRFINYTWGDEWLLMAPTVVLLVIIVLMMVMVAAGTGLFNHYRYKKRAELIVQEINIGREVEIKSLRKEAEIQRRKVIDLQGRIARQNDALMAVRELARQTDKIVGNTT